jgi:bacterioferritin-associated ferredoxin
MQADDELCLCFHITCRKVLNFIRVHQVKIPSQLADCGGAGTGCGWCRKQLEKLMILSSENPPSAADVEGWLAEHTPDRQKYSEARAKYRRAKEQASQPQASQPQEIPDSPKPQ